MLWGGFCQPHRNQKGNMTTHDPCILFELDSLHTIDTDNIKINNFFSVDSLAHKRIYNENNIW